MKQRNVIIKSLKIEKVLKKGPSLIGAASQSQSSSWFTAADDEPPSSSSSLSPTKLKANIKHMESKTSLIDVGGGDDDEDDCDIECSSVSSMEEDELAANIWDNSELRVRGIDVESFCDFYGKKLTFVQLFKLRSAYYTKSIKPSAGEMFKGAEKIHRFGNRSLTLDQFLNEDKQYNILEIDLKNDRNAIRFTRFFADVTQLHGLKNRKEKYDRYAFNRRRSSADDLSSNPSMKRKMQSTNGGQMQLESQSISALGLSPRKIPTSSNAMDMRKSQMSLQQINEIHRKERQTKQTFKWTGREDESPMRVNTNISNSSNAKSPTFFMESRKQSQNSDINEMAGMVYNGDGCNYVQTERSKLSSPPMKSVLQRNQFKKATSTFSSSPSRNVSIRIMQGSSPENPQIDQGLRNSSGGQFRLQLKTVHQDDDNDQQQQQFSLMRTSLKGGMKFIAGSENKSQQKFYSQNVSPWKRESTSTLTTTTTNTITSSNQPQQTQGQMNQQSSFNNFSTVNSVQKLLGSDKLTRGVFNTQKGTDSVDSSRLPSIIVRQKHSSSMVSEPIPVGGAAATDSAAALIAAINKPAVKNNRLFIHGSMGSISTSAVGATAMNGNASSSGQLRQTQVSFNTKRETFTRNRQKNVSTFTPKLDQPQTQQQTEFYTHRSTAAKDL